MKQGKISIIVPFKEMNHYVQECFDHCVRLDYDDFEIIALPDEPVEIDMPHVKVLPTGPVFPSIKRNLGIEHSDAEYCAFIDSDAYPVDKNWLSKARDILQDPSIGCVGGPNYIPHDATLKERVGTAILYSHLGIGAFPTKNAEDGSYREIKELASSNLIVRSSLFEKVGGFHSGLLTGEDAYLCFMIGKAGYKVVWADDVAVFHHRRPFPGPFLRSVYVYGRDKATLLKLTFTADKFYYFIPSAFVVFLVAGLILSCLVPWMAMLYGGILLLYLLLVLAQSLCFNPAPVKLYGFIGIPLTHIWYGIGFMYGMIKRYKKDE